MKKSRWILPALLALFAGCMHPNPERAVIAKATNVVARLSISPPEFARTVETKGLWLSQTTAQLTVSLSALSAVDTVLGGFRISASLDTGKPLYEYMSGAWMVMPPVQGEQHMAITLSDAGLSKDSLGPTPILYSTVVLVTKAGGSILDSFTLTPVQGPDGPSYGANIPLRLDMSWDELEVFASAPLTLSRDLANQGRMVSAMIGDYPAVMIMDVPRSKFTMGALTLSDSVGLELLFDKPETLWTWDQTSHAPVKTSPAGWATVFSQVKLTDLKSKGRANTLGNCVVHCQLFTEDLDITTGDSTLKPIHGVSGFYYGTNVPVPIE